MTQALAQLPDPPSKDWREKRQRRYLSTSASQFETYELCPRKWWLGKVRKLPELPRSVTVLGTCLHGVLERWLTADDLGRDANGQPVNLYPDGWHIARNKWNPLEIEGEITPIEQDLIKKLVATAIQDGILKRAPWRMIERPFQRSIIELGCPWCNSTGMVPVQGSHNSLFETCPTCKGDKKGTHVQIKGYIDLMEADGLDDHKSVKTMRYAKSPKALAKNTQILIYAYEFIQTFRENGWPLPPRIKLRHNQYCKDPEDPRVRQTEAFVTVEEVENKWAEIVRASCDMVRMRDTIEFWHQIPDPVQGANACNAYGGCDYRTICSGRESEIGYEQRLARHKAGEYNARVQPVTINGLTPPKGSEMTTFDSRLAEKRALVGAPQGVPGSVNPPAPPQGFSPPAPAAPQGQFPQQPPQGQPQYGPPPQQPQYPQAPQQGPPAYPQAPQAQPQYGPPQGQPAPQAPAYQPPPQQPPAAQPQMGPPPWAASNCGACFGAGFNTQGNPCRICDSMKAQQQQMTSADFVVTNMGNGTCYYKSRDGRFEGYSPLPNAGAPAQAEVRSPNPPPQQPPQQPQAPQYGPPPGQPQQPYQQGQQPPPPPQGPPAGPEENDGSEDPKAGSGGKAGRPGKSFIFMYNCVAGRGYEARGDRKVHQLNQVFEEVKKTLAAAAGVASFYDMDPFQRKDMLRKMAPQVAQSFGTALVVGTGISNAVTDWNEFAHAVRAYAGFEVFPQSM